MQEISIDALKGIGNDFLKKLYSDFSFFLIDGGQIDKDYLYNLLKNFKFITYNISNVFDVNYFLLNLNANFIKNISNPINLIFCFERKCIIVERIDTQLFKYTIQKLKENSFIIKNASNDKISKTYEIQIDNEVSEEISSFLNYLPRNITKNKIGEFTIRPIILFMIRRYFCPTNFFKCPTFFDQRYKNEMKLKEDFLKFLNTKKEKDVESNFQQFLYTIKESIAEKENNEIKNIQEFKENQFILLRRLASNENYNFYLVFHIESFHVFMMKKAGDPKLSKDKMQHEINFCTNYSHRCLVSFYGFVKKDEEIVGFVYEYLSNGTLYKFIRSNHQINDKLFCLNAMSRIYQGVDYLHSHSLIHRDISPFNILLNHDFIPFIMDFETVRHPEDESSGKEMTGNFGSYLYSSPEQEQTNNYSYPTDIYSFGLTIYFIFSGEHMRSKKGSVSGSNASQDIELLITKCLQLNPEKRIKTKDIGLEIGIINTHFSNFESFLKDNKSDISNVTQFVIENLFLYNFDIEKLIFWIYQLSYFQELFIIRENKSALFCNLGIHYYYGINIFQDYVKAKEFFELSAKLNDSESLLYLGYIYLNGRDVKQDYIKAKEYFEKSANLKNSNAMNELGNIYLNGLGLEQNYSKAIEYYELSAENNNSSAFNNLGMIYQKGIGVKQNYSTAFKYFKLSADQDDCNGLNNLGNLYKSGCGTDKDYIKAKKCYEKSAEGHHSDAFYNLGLIYFTGKGVDIDYDRAREYFELAANQNHSSALFYLGDMYRDGIGVEINYSKAKEYYELSASQNNSYGLLKLGLLYQNGYGVQQNFSYAKKYYELSANLGNSNALLNLGNFYEFGFGVPINYPKAREYYEKAAEMNDSEAFLDLAYLYMAGHGVKKDYLKVIEYYEKAANLNNSSAYVNLGNMYLFGIGVERDYSKAKEYYELAKQDYFLANYFLGYMYENGLGVVKDYPKAIYLYNLLAKRNFPNAIVSLGNLYINIYQNYSKAKEYYEMAAKLGNADALFELGELYLYGEGFPIDYSKAKDYYEKSSFLQHPRAIFRLGQLYLTGKGVEINHLKAKEYFEMSIKKKVYEAYYFLGSCYSNGYIYDVDINKAIYYYLKCIENKRESIMMENNGHEMIASVYHINNVRYQSYNDLGLIYITVFQDIEKAIEYIKEAAYAEYPFGQNNFGLIHQFYLNNIEKAKHFYKRATEHQFALSEYNLGYILEKEGKTKESIDFYIRASDYQNMQMKFRNIPINDTRLNISSSFILCLTNLKLVLYHMAQFDYNQSKMFFIRSLIKLKAITENTLVQFYFHFRAATNHSKEIFSYIKDFILYSPLFSLPFQPHVPNLNLNNKYILYNMYLNQIDEKNIFDDEGELFDYVVSDFVLKTIFIEAIEDIVAVMENVLYTPPYCILFGRINIEKIKGNENQIREINDQFYKGFDIELI